MPLPNESRMSCGSKHRGRASARPADASRLAHKSTLPYLAAPASSMRLLGSMPLPMTRCIETARATAKVATDTWSWIGELALHRFVARYHNIKGGWPLSLMMPGAFPRRGHVSILRWPYERALSGL